MDEQNHSKFVMESSEAQALAEASDLTLLHLLPTLVSPAQSLARPPVSNFHVAAVGLGSSGRVFIGVNLEFPGLPLHHSVHAEQFLITNLAINNEPALQAFAVSSAPCGHCRQFLQELRNAPDLQLLITDHQSDDHQPFRSLSQLLPDRFGPFDLLDTSKASLLLEPRHNGLTLSNPNISGKSLPILEALDAANKSHAPYSQCPSGIALVDDRGKVYKGSYKESAAYNPSLGPVQAAVIAYVAAGGGEYGKIVAGVLVEMEDAQVKQEATARMILGLISPQCQFIVAHCKHS